MSRPNIQPYVVVLGATGCVGRGAVEAAIAQGRPVVAVARDVQGLEILANQYPNADLTLVTGSVANEEDGQALAARLVDLGRPIAGVVAAIGGPPERGRLLDQHSAFLARKLDEDLLPHLIAARHLLPLLSRAARKGHYVLIGGPCSERAWAGYGHRSVSAAATQMLARVLHDEARALAVRVQMLAIDSPVRGKAGNRHACEQWPSSLSVGTAALALLDARVPALANQAVVRLADVPIDATEAHLHDARALLQSVITPNKNNKTHKAPSP